MIGKYKCRFKTVPVSVKLQGVYVFQSASVCAVPELSKPAQIQEYPTDMTTYFMIRHIDADRNSC